MFLCIQQTFTISDPTTRICWSFWCILVLLGWICGSTFIYSVASNRNQQRTAFSILLIATTITIVWNMTLLWVVSLYFVELFRLIRNDIDAYNPNEYHHTYIHKNCEMFSHVSQLFFSSSYILTLLMYFYRLYHLFADTTYTISKLRIKIFITLILLMTICAISQVIFLFVSGYDRVFNDIFCHFTLFGMEFKFTSNIFKKYVKHIGKSQK